MVRNKRIKALSRIIAAICVPVMILSGITFAYAYAHDCWENEDDEIAVIRTGEDIKKQAVENISRQYLDDVLSVYSLYVQSFSEDRDVYGNLMERFNSDNTNYFFNIKPVKDKSLPELSNYYEEDYQYRESAITDVCVERQYIEEKYDYSIKNIIDAVLEQYYEDCGVRYIYNRDEYNQMLKENKDDDFFQETVRYVEYRRLLNLLYIDVELPYIRAGLYLDYSQSETVINLEEDEEFISKYKAFEKLLDEKKQSDLEYYDMFYQEYNKSDEQIVFGARINKYVQVEVTQYVRADITAKDEYYFSNLIKYSDFVGKSLMICIAAGIILVMASALIVAGAGRVKGKETIVQGRLGKIPLEIMTLAAAGIVLIMGKESYKVVLCISAVAAGVIYPVILGSLAVQAKAKTVWKNSLTGKLVRVIKRASVFMWKNLHIYGKVLGVYGLVTVFEIVMIFWAADGDFMEEFPIVIIILEKTAVGALLAYIAVNMNRLKKGAKKIAEGNTDYKLDTLHMLPVFRKHGEDLNGINEGIQLAVDRQMKSERMKTELITNVSHDIKTPITSIITYVDLLGKEELDNEKASEYIEVLERQSMRLKKLVQDLIDASKASTGNMPVNKEQVNINVMVEQILGEVEEKLADRAIKPIVKFSGENITVEADGRLTFRVFDNLMQNVCKYAAENTRVYIDTAETENAVKIEIKNISANELNVSGDELMERFVRGDASRNTEGSGLGLSIAKSLMELQGGTLEIKTDGDLFKAVVMLKR